jgi:hypothetical protein
MSTKSTITVPQGMNNIKRVQWAALANGETGDFIGPDLAPWSDRSVQVAGTFGTSGSVQWEGSNDGVNWALLNAPQGTSLTWTAAAIKQVLEGALYMRPRVTAGDGTTSLIITVQLRLPTLRAG